jgi:hypothetical protein
MDAKKVEEIIEHARKHDMVHLEERIKALGAALQDAVGEGSQGHSNTYSAELINITHRPGWTTLVEHAFVLASVEEMIALAHQLAGRKQALLQMSRLVGLNPQPLPPG